MSQIVSCIFKQLISPKYIYPQLMCNRKSKYELLELKVSCRYALEIQIIL